jgi:hypothetical protein
MMHILGILLAAAAGFILGGLWYSPALFGHVWARESGTPETHDPDPKAQIRFFVILLVLLAVAAAILDLILIHWTGTAHWSDGLTVGAVGGLLAAAVVGMDALFERKGLTLFLINAGYYLLTSCVMGVIVAVL